MNQTVLTNILLAVVLALSGWSLKETTDQGKTLSRLVEAKVSTDRDLLELRARVSASEATVARAVADIAVIQARLSVSVPPSR
jgi:outer membrane protein TolC